MRKLKSSIRSSIKGFLIIPAFINLKSKLRYMKIDIITKEDLQEFKTELLEEIKNLLQVKNSEKKLWLRSTEVKELLNISTGTLQNLRISETLSYTRIGGTLYYNYKDIEQLLNKKL